MQNGTATLENSSAVPCKTKYTNTLRANNYTLGDSFQTNENLHLHENLCVNVYSSFTDNNHTLETMQMPSSGRMVEQMVVYPFMEYYSVVERKELLTLATTWMSLQGIMVRQGWGRPISKGYHIIPFVQHS